MYELAEVPVPLNFACLEEGLAWQQGNNKESAYGSSKPLSPFPSPFKLLCIHRFLNRPFLASNGLGSFTRPKPRCTGCQLLCVLWGEE